MTWLGLTAHYTDTEQRTMRRIRQAGATQAELAFLHEAKSRFDGVLKNPPWYWRTHYQNAAR